MLMKEMMATVCKSQNSTLPGWCKIFVGPGLFKKGNADREHYDIETVMEKAEVSLHRLYRLKESAVALIRERGEVVDLGNAF